MARGERREGHHDVLQASFPEDVLNAANVFSSSNGTALLCRFPASSYPSIPIHQNKGKSIEELIETSISRNAAKKQLKESTQHVATTHQSIAGRSRFYKTVSIVDTEDGKVQLLAPYPSHLLINIPIKPVPSNSRWSGSENSGS